MRQNLEIYMSYQLPGLGKSRINDIVDQGLAKVYQG